MRKTLTKTVAMAAIATASFAGGTFAHAGLVTWEFAGPVSSPGSQLTTTEYFPRPLVAGETVRFQFVVDTLVQRTVVGSSGFYESAVVSARVIGSDWSIELSPLERGAVTVTNDELDYGDSLIVIANMPPTSTATWFQAGIDLRNTGGPSPGPGPFGPFGSIDLPSVPPALESWPSATFYVGARRDTPGNALDGAVYFGQITSVTAVPEPNTFGLVALGLLGALAISRKRIDVSEPSRAE
jgi:hypothetical protein